MPERESIPEPMKRQVRQECRFGCVICGCPVFHYDHIVEYSEVLEHKVENLALLCEMHHGAKTTGKLPAHIVEAKRRSPFNKNRNFTSGYWLVGDTVLRIQLGSNVAGARFLGGIGTYDVIWVNGVSMLTVNWENGYLSPSMLLSDRDGNLLLKVDQGEIVVSASVWDYRYEGTTLDVRGGQGDYLLSMELTSNLVHVKRGQFLTRSRDGFVVYPDGGLIAVLDGNEAGGCWASEFFNNRRGAAGLLNSRNAPLVQRRKGYGFFRSA